MLSVSKTKQKLPHTIVFVVIGFACTFVDIREFLC